AYHREQAEHAAGILLADAQLSTLGRRFIGIARERLQSWGSSELPDDVRTAAGQSTLDHLVRWRLRHLRPPATTVTELAEAWLHHRPKPVVRPAPPTLDPSDDPITHPRLALTQTWLGEPDIYAAYP